MNKKVFTSMLTLTIAFLCGMYIFKIFFPQEFVMSVENENIVAVGKYIDTHKWAYYMLGTVTSFATYWLYLCAVCKKRYLNWRECLLVLATIGMSIGLNFIDIKAISVFSFISMIILPALFKCNSCKTLALVLSIHTLAQYLSLSIRNLPMYMQNVNSLSLFLMNFECMLWLILFYVIYNYKEKEI